ncbi:MAG: hypothetical protein ABEJ36_03465 [Candidatus Nanosalina sp.]
MAQIFLVFSHILAFSVLFIDSLFDFFNNNDIPDEFAALGVIGGILLHGIQAFVNGSLQPVIWSLGVGTVFSIYGWGAYYKGMWGGADAFALSALGFSVAGPVNGEFGFTYVFDLIFNFMAASVFVTLIYAVYKFREQEGELGVFTETVLENEKKVSIGVLGAGILSAILVAGGMNGYLFFLLMMSLLGLYIFLKTIEEEFMVREVNASELEGGEVPAPGQGFGKRIRGLSEEEVESIDSENFEIRTGVPFIPVFLISILLTDLTASGMWMLYMIY